MVVGVDEEREVHPLRQPRVIGRRLHGEDIGELLALRALGEVAHHVGLDVRRVDPALRQHAREAHREVAGARADVGDHRIGLERERLDELVRLLPGVALGVVEDLRPFLRIAELVLVRMRRLRGGARKEADSQQETDRC